MRGAGCIANVVLACVVVTAVVWFLGESGQPVSQQAIDWVNQYYQAFPIGGGWRVVKIEADGSIVRVRVILQDAQAQAIMAMPPSNQFRVIQVACPGRREDIWALLDDRQDVEITAASVLTPNYPFIDAPCRDQF